MILLIDNYDSFSYNVFQLVSEAGKEVRVIRNDECTVKEIEAMNPDAIIISPGPGKPQDAGICIDAVKHFAGRKPVLGICLGHQAICEAFGATVSYARELMHGKKKNIIRHGTSPLFDGLPEVFPAARYHSLAVIEDTIPDTLKVTAVCEDGEIMAVEHTDYPVYGLQFHPESVMTPDGKKIIENFMTIVKKGSTQS